MQISEKDHSKVHAAKKIEKNAWKGIYRKAQIKVPENRIQKYKKLMQNRGQKSTVRITR